VIPDEVSKEIDSFSHWRSSKGSCLLCSYVERERERASERVVCSNRSFTALVPFWAVWPFEMMVVPHHRHLGSLSHMTADEEHDMADMIKQVTTKYDNLFKCRFPYSMGIHQAPTGPSPSSTTTSSSCSSSSSTLGSDHAEAQDGQQLFHLHMHFYPPLLRSATVRKFLVGYEMVCEPQRDITPEQAAARLRDLSSVLYRDEEA
jgi:UDPglucose--hexose-1-phosphate uridylyltransferase